MLVRLWKFDFMCFIFINEIDDFVFIHIKNNIKR